MENINEDNIPSIDKSKLQNFSYDSTESVAFQFCDLDEDKKEVDGINILAKVKGPAFFPETTSRNNVHYTKGAWGTALSDPEYQRRLGDRLVFGTIGHKPKLDDDDLRNGLVSHIVSDTYINESGVGVGEYLILNTPTGRILNTVLRAGSKLRVSTKAKGLFKTSSNISGNRAIDPEHFKVDRIDFVIDPGYLEAFPDVLESLNELGRLSNESSSLKNEEIINENIPKEIIMADSNKVVEIYETQIQEHKTEKVNLINNIEELQKVVASVNEKLAVTKATLKEFQDVGSLSDFSESLSFKKDITSRDLGTAEEIEEALKESETAISKMSETLEQTTADISESLITEEDVEVLEAYKEIGSVEDIQKMYESAKEMTATLIDSKVESIVEKYKVEEELVRKFLDTGMDFDMITESISAIRDVTETHNKEKNKGELSTKNFQNNYSGTPSGDSINESKASGVVSLATRLMTGGGSKRSAK